LSYYGIGLLLGQTDFLTTILGKPRLGDAAYQGEQIRKAQWFDEIADHAEPIEGPHAWLVIAPGHDDHGQACQAEIMSQFSQDHQARLSWKIQVEHNSIRKIPPFQPNLSLQALHCILRSVSHVNTRPERFRFWLKPIPGERMGLA